MKLKKKTVVRVNASVLFLKGKSIIIAYWREEQTTSKKIHHAASGT